MGLLGDLVVRIVGDTQDFVRKVDQAGRKMSQFDRDMMRISKNLIKTGKALTLGLTLPILGMAAAAIKTAGDFETSMNRVRAVTGATADEMQELEAVARELGATTQFSAKQAADAMSFLAMAGFETNKIIGAMPATLNLAAAAQIDMATAADIASNILAGFNLDADELSGAIDVMAKTFTSSNTDLVQLGEAMSLVAPISEGLGVSIEETSAAIGILSNAGIQASSAGTGLRRTLSVLVTESDRLGIATLDAEGNMRPLADILDDLEEKGLSTADALEIFGQRGGPAISVLLAQGGDALRDFTAELENAGGTAERIAQIQMEGLNGALKRFRSTAEEAGISIGNILLPKIIDLLEAVRGLFERFNALDESTQRMILQYAGMAAAIGPLLIAIGLAIKAFFAIRTAVRLLNITMAANPVILLTAALAALAATVVLVLPVIVRAIKRHREYERQIELTREALEDLTEVERQRERAGLVEAREREAETIRDLNTQLRELRRVEESETSASFTATLAIADLNDVRQAAIEKFDLLQERVVEIDRLTVKYNLSIVAEQEAFDDTTPSLEDYIEAHGDLAVALENVTDKAERWALILREQGNRESQRSAKLAELQAERLEHLATIVNDTADEYEEADGRQAAVDSMRDARRADALATYEAGLLEQAELDEDYTARSAAWWTAWADSLKDGIDDVTTDRAEAMVSWSEMERRAAMETIAAWGEVFTFQEDELTEFQKKLEDFLNWYDDNYIDRIVNSTQAMVAALLSIGTARAAAEMQTIDEILAGQIAADLAIIASGDSTAEAKVSARERVTAAEEDAAAQIRAIQREQAERDKRIGIFNAVIDTAQAVIGMLANPGGLPGFVLSLLAGATGLAQIAAISAQPLPALAHGGIVTGPTPAMVGEGGQPEIIFPLDQLGDFLSRRGDFDNVGGGDSTVIVNLDGAQILKFVGKATDDGRLLINQRAVV